MGLRSATAAVQHSNAVKTGISFKLLANGRTISGTRPAKSGAAYRTRRSRSECRSAPPRSQPQCQMSLRSAIGSLFLPPTLTPRRRAAYRCS